MGRYSSIPNVELLIKYFCRSVNQYPVPSFIMHHLSIPVLIVSVETVHLLSFFYIFYNHFVPMGFFPWEIQVSFPRESHALPNLQSMLGVLVFP